MSITIDRRSSRSHHLPVSSTRLPRILCVDDDPDLHTTFELRMRAYDVTICRAFYGTQGVSEAVSNRPDLILMDLSMPNGDGSFLLNCIKQNHTTRSIPVIVLTGMRDPKLKHRLLRGGADVFLRKPTRFDELLHHMSRFVDIRTRENKDIL